MKKEEQTVEEWIADRKRKKANMLAMQALPYEIKVKRAELRAFEFIEKLDDMKLNAHISVGGLDSITLLVFLRHIGIDIPAISVSLLEDRSIQRIHKELGVISIAPGKSKIDILNEYGFPVISKKIAGRIETLQNPNDKNQTVRHAIMTGECGAQGMYRKNSRMKLPQKWLELFAGYENENEGVNYQIAPFKVSNKCCLYMKEQPCNKWAKEHNSKPFLGLMASEGGQREEALMEHGCNYFGRTVIRSAPFTPFLRQDLLQLALDLNVPVPEIYGQIERMADGTLYTTGAQRTGCSMCGFGVHLEKRPHRFDQLRARNEKEWEFWMYRCCTDSKTGERFGWGRVLDYIGVEWENDWKEGEDSTGQVPGQMRIDGV